jgi:hypothetical protein
MCEPDDISRLDLWIVWIKGAKGKSFLFIKFFF